MLRFSPSPLGVAASLVLTALLGLGCGSTEESAPPESAAALACKAAGAGALSGCAVAKLPAAYYVDQANRYFDALDVDAPADSTPAYAELVARWEWPPWLKLTGFTREQMESTDKVVKKFAPADVSHRDCRAFATQPFARCRVSFDYVNPTHGKPCFIYEEFTFNDAGEQTFIEAWSDLPGLTPILDPKDPWGERTAIHRLSTRIPGLGSPSGHIDLDGAAMKKAAAQDPEVGDFVARAKDFWPSFTAEGELQGPDYFARGCGW
jgi:hypothetical protein